MNQLTKQEVEGVIERKFRTCTVEGCTNKHSGKGLCQTHYTRFSRYGSTDLPDRNPHHMYGTRQYYSWSNMVQRCTNPNNNCYSRYGGRGIKIPEKWKTFRGFWEDMQEGYEEHLTLDRIDNDKSYSKENCRWVTMFVQNRNTSQTRNLTFQDVTLCVADWSSKLGIAYETIIDRLRRGWSVERTLTEPVKRKRSPYLPRSKRTF